MRLVAFGCSNTFGQALPDVWDYKKNVSISKQGPSKYAWPQVLADKLNLECVNLGTPGASNKEVWFHIVNTEFKKSDIVIILWPGRSRWCIIKDLVPSMGSITHEKSLFVFFVLNSSPIIPSFGNFFFISFLKNNSNALSIFVTGSKPFLFLDLLFSLNFPLNLPKYNLFIFFGSEFKNL